MNEGDAIPELRVTPDKYLPHRYAGASGDFNPIHIDKEFATAVGLPSNILHGLYGMAQVARAVQAAAGGDPRRVRRLSVQFRGMGFPEQEIVVSGTVRPAPATPPSSTSKRRRATTGSSGTPRRSWLRRSWRAAVLRRT